MSSQVYQDPVVALVHAIRDKMVDECDGDHQKLMQQVRERQEKTQRRVIIAPNEAQSAPRGR